MSLIFTILNFATVSYIMQNCYGFWIYHCRSVAQLCLTLFDLMDCSTLGFLSFSIFRSLLKSCPLSWWCHPTISSWAGPFSYCPQSFPISGSFPMSRLFVSGAQSIGASASASVFPINIQGWFPLGFDLLVVQGTLKSSLEPQFKNINSSVLSLLYGPTLTSVHDYWRNHRFDYSDLCWKSNVSPF